MTQFSVIETGGKQYKVSAGDKVKIEKIEAKEGEGLVFDKVLLKSDGDAVTVGTPYISGAKVEGKVLAQERYKKVIIFKYHAKTRQRKKRGHRQYFTEVEVTKI